LVLFVPVLLLDELFLKVLNLPLVHAFAGLFADDTGMWVDELQRNNFINFLCNALELSDAPGLS
jgi:hypothetical protein